MKEKDSVFLLGVIDVILLYMFSSCPTIDQPNKLDLTQRSCSNTIKKARHNIPALNRLRKRG